MTDFARNVLFVFMFFTNPFLHSHSYSFRTAFVDLNLYWTKWARAFVCFSFFFFYFFPATCARLSWTLDFWIRLHVKLFYRIVSYFVVVLITCGVAYGLRLRRLIIHPSTERHASCRGRNRSRQRMPDSRGRRGDGKFRYKNNEKCEWCGLIWIVRTV